MFNNFWNTIKKPIIGLAPMDGVTDTAFRQIVDQYGKPDILFTEFVPVSGLCRKLDRFLPSLQIHQTKTPIIVQLFGNDPDEFYQAAKIVLKLGFSGIDINMGCPDNNVMKKGGGAALILKPKLAQEIVLAVKTGIKQQIVGVTSRREPKKAEQLASIFGWRRVTESTICIKKIALSIKTRLGYDKIQTEEWISALLETKPDAISLHGRIVTQRYTGKVYWNEIAKAAKLCHQKNTLILGNGNIRSLTDAYKNAKQYDLDGILIGRAALGNPWIFQETQPDIETLIKVILEHCRLFKKYRPDLHFYPMRKHLAWYCKGFRNANKIRDQLMKVENIKDVKQILSLVALNHQNHK